MNKINNLLEKEFDLLFTSIGQKIRVNANPKDTLHSILAQIFKEETFKIKSGMLKGEKIDFNKTISENKIEDGNIINIISSKDLDVIKFVKEYTEIEFSLFFISGHTIKIEAKANDYFQSILEICFNKENITKFKSATLKNKQIDFNKTISENKIENGDIINIIASKDFDIISFVKMFSEIEITLSFTNGETTNVRAKPNKCFGYILKKYIKKQNINKIKSATVNGEQIDFNKTISENKIEKGNIINLIVPKDFPLGSFINDNSNFNKSMNYTSYNFYNPFNISKNTDIDFCLLFINGETINVSAKPTDIFHSILEKYLDQERIKKISKATLNNNIIDFNKTISENKIENENIIYLTVPKDFYINSKKFFFIHFFLLLLNGDKINIVENINTSFISVLKKYFNEEMISKIKSAKLNGKSIDFDKTLLENKIEEKSTINLITSKDFHFNNEDEMNITSSSLNDFYNKANEKNISQIEFCLLFTNGQNFKVIAYKNFSFQSVLEYFFKAESINKIKEGLLNGKKIDFNKTISENKIENGNNINLIVTKDFNLNNDIKYSFYISNNIYYYYNTFYNSNIRETETETNKNLSSFEFFISFMNGVKGKIEGKPSDILKLKLKEYIGKKFPNHNYLLNNKINALLGAESIDINKTLYENKIFQGSNVLFIFDKNFCNIDDCKIHLHTKMHDHGLVLLYSNRSWICDVCGLKFTNKEQTYYCSICDYDVCNHCIGNIKKYPLNYIFNNEIFFKYFNYQFHEHKLIYCRTSRYDDKITNWTCQICDKGFGNENWSFFCTNCNYDICLSCAKKQYKNIDYTLINFIYLDKIHFLNVTNLGKNWKCNLCNLSFDMATRSYSCLKCKNFNLCTDCIFDLAISINKKTKHGFTLHLIRGK